MVSFILSRSGDVNRRSCGGETALFPAALHWDVSSIRLLLGAGADPTVRNAKGQTALDMAMLSFAGDARPESRDETFRLLRDRAVR